MDSILTSVKKLLGITEDYEHFDQDLILHINSVFMILNQIGVGPDKGFSISDKHAMWSDFTDNKLDIEAVKSYVFLRVRLLFDPPQSSVLTESYKRQIDELEWRLNVAVDPRDKEENQNGSL